LVLGINSSSAEWVEEMGCVISVRDKGDECEARDPADLLPFEKELEPHDPNVEVLPKAFQGTDKVIYGGDNVA